MQTVWSRTSNLWNFPCQEWPRTSKAIIRLANKNKSKSRALRCKILANHVFACYLSHGVPRSRASSISTREEWTHSILTRNDTHRKGDGFRVRGQPGEHWPYYYAYTFWLPSRRLRWLWSFSNRDKASIRASQQHASFVRDDRVRLCNEGQSQWYHGDFQLGFAECADLVKIEDKYLMKTRDPVTFKQFQIMTTTISELVSDLIITATETMPPALNRSVNSLDSAYNMIRLLKSEGYPRYRDPKPDPLEADEHRRRLNEANRKILQGWSPFLKDKLVGKICFNLLVCEVPPGTKNFNALLLEFIRNEECELADVMMQFFLGKSKQLPSKGTILCFLQHTRFSGDVVGFADLIRRMSGYDGRGINLRRRHYVSIRDDQVSRQWAIMNRGVVAGRYVVQPAMLCLQTSETIVQGLLDFGMLEDAASFFVCCLADGFLVHVGYMRRLFDCCIMNASGAAAQILVMGLTDNLEEMDAILRGGPEYAELADRVPYLVNMASGFNQAAAHPPSDSYSLPHLSPMLMSVSQLSRRGCELGLRAWLNAQRTFIQTVDTAIATAKQSLFADSPLLDRLEMAEKSFDGILRHRHVAETTYGLAIRMGHVVRLSREIELIDANIRQLDQDLISLIEPDCPDEVMEPASSLNDELDDDNAWV